MTNGHNNTDARSALTKAHAARVRAARAFAGREQKEVAEALGMSLPTYKRIEGAKRDASPAEMERIADVCKVPRVFMEFGFGSVTPATAEDVRALRDAFEAALNERLGALAEALVTREEALAGFRRSILGDANEVERQ